MHLIPGTWPHLHLLVSVFPSVGLVFAVGLYVAAMVTNNTQMQRVGLLVFGGLAVLGVPTWASGTHSRSAMTRPGLPAGVGDAHIVWAYVTLFFLFITGAVALLAGC